MTDAEQARNLVLGGLMGTGKTTIARRLAMRLGRPWVDTDHAVEALAGCAVAEIFATRGEEAFRELEAEVVADVSTRGRHIVALGGGALLDPANVALLRRGGLIVLLVGDARVLAGRAARAGARKRPLLEGETDIEGRLRRLAHERRDAYEQAADHIVDTTDGRSLEELAHHIVTWAATQPGLLTDAERKAVAA